MAYSVINFKTKKQLKEAVLAWNEFNQSPTTNTDELPQPVRCFQPGLGPDLRNFTGSVALEGPHYPRPHTWYASAQMENGIVVKVK